MTTTLPEITEVKRLTLRPGDRVVVRVDRYLDAVQAHDLKQHLRGVLGIDDLTVIITEPGVDLEVLSVDDDDEHPSFAAGRRIAAHLAAYERARGGKPWRA